MEDRLQATALSGKTGWGDTIEEAEAHRKGDQPGWKRFVVNAVERHVLQEQSARRILVSEESWQGEERTVEQTYECDCGKSFLSRTGLAVH